MTESDAEFICPWCGQVAHKVFIRGHLECNACHRVVADCCDGEVAERNDDSSSN
jgi:ribosomal protein L37AE/L43A